jgi:hypothetical protein
VRSVSLKEAIAANLRRISSSMWSTRPRTSDDTTGALEAVPRLPGSRARSAALFQQACSSVSVKRPSLSLRPFREGFWALLGYQGTNLLISFHNHIIRFGRRVRSPINVKFGMCTVHTYVTLLIDGDLVYLTHSYTSEATSNGT